MSLADEYAQKYGHLTGAAPGGDWRTSWAIVPPNVNPERYAEAARWVQEKQLGWTPEQFWREYLAKHNGRALPEMLVDPNGPANPFEAPAPAPAAVNPPADPFGGAPAAAQTTGNPFGGAPAQATGNPFGGVPDGPFGGAQQQAAGNPFGGAPAAPAQQTISLGPSGGLQITDKEMRTIIAIVSALREHAS